MTSISRTLGPVVGSLVVAGAIVGCCWLGVALCSPDCVGTAAAAPAASAAPSATSATSDEDGHYCDARAFSPALMKRKAELLAQVVTVAGAPQELANGYSFTVPGTFRETGEWIDGLRGCCPTLDIEVRFAAKRGASVVRLTGRAGAKEFIRAELEPLFTARK